MTIHIEDITRITRYEPGFKTADARLKDRKRKATLAGLERAVAAAGETETWKEGDADGLRD
ncbi:hypothetical protein [Roseibium sp.]|uniref:hypothetical protein n=1 Tax=Roseibium sp. TaxID=1936156 RepID=UPI00326DFB41